VQYLAGQAEKYADSVIFQLFPRTLLTSSGKVTARRHATPDGGEADDRRADMFDNAVQLHKLTGEGIVWPAVQQLMREHMVEVGDLLPLVQDNPFVPLGRETIVARGLHAGLTGDFLVSTHLLVPQIEHAIRILLARAGSITSTLTSEGIQDERSLNDLLAMPELEPILGADIIFSLQGLLVERHGANLRNLVAHGLLHHGAFYTAQAVYLWWLVLRLCCIPVLNGIHRILEEGPVPEQTVEQESTPGDQEESMRYGPAAPTPKMDEELPQ